MADPIDIRALRERLKWSQRQLAEHLGVDQATVSRMENGQAPKGPTVRLLRALHETPLHETGSAA